MKLSINNNVICIILFIVLIILILYFSNNIHFFDKKENLVNLRSAVDNKSISNPHSDSSNNQQEGDLMGNYFSYMGTQVNTNNPESITPSGPNLKFYLVGSPKVNIDKLFLMNIYKHSNIQINSIPPAGNLYFSNNNGRNFKNLKGIGRLVRIFRDKDSISVACVGYGGQNQNNSGGEFIYIIKDVENTKKTWELNTSIGACGNSIFVNRFSTTKADSIADWVILEKGINGEPGCFASSAVDGALYYSPLYCNKWIIQNPIQGVNGKNSLNLPSAAVDKLLIHDGYIYCRTFIKDSRSGALPGKSIRRRVLYPSNNDFGLHEVLSWPGIIGSFCIFENHLYFINVYETSYLNPKTNVPNKYPAGCVVSYFLGAAGVDSSFKKAIIRNNFSLIGFQNIVDIKCIGNTLVMLMSEGSNTGIITSTLNSQNSVQSISSAISSNIATPIPFSGIDLLSIGQNWKP